MRLLLALPAAVGLAALAGSTALATTPSPSASAPVQTVKASYANPQVIATVASKGTTSASTGAANSYDVKLGGFSALAAYRNADGTTSTTDFWTLADRGANGTGPTPAAGQASTQGFVVPSYAPEIMHIHYSGSVVQVLATIPFHLPAGEVDPARADITNPATTTGNCPAGSSPSGAFVGPDTLNGNSCNTVTGLGINPSEEADYSADGTTLLHPDPYGLDTESLAVAPDGSFWVGDEYTPSVVHIAADGTELLRIVPIGYNLLDSYTDVPVAKILPRSWNSREINKGTEGLAMSPDGTHVYAALQGPLNAACSTANDNFEVRRSLRITDVNTTSTTAPTLNHEWLYRTESSGPNITATSKLFISDMSFDPTSGRVLVDERGSKGDEASIWAFDPNGPQTDIKNNAGAENTTATDATGAGCFDYSPPANVVPIGTAAGTKLLAANLQNAVDTTGAAAPYNIYKIEGITLLPTGTLAVVNDNDFGFVQSGSGANTTYTDQTATTAGPDSQLREYAIPAVAPVAAASASLPEAPYAVLLPLIALGAIGGVVAVRRRGTRISAH